MLKDRVGIVTGGASGIGRATVFAMAAAGARVMIGDVDEDKAFNEKISPLSHVAAITAPLP